MQNSISLDKYKENVSQYPSLDLQTPENNVDMRKKLYDAPSSQSYYSSTSDSLQRSEGYDFSQKNAGSTVLSSLDQANTQLKRSNLFARKDKISVHNNASEPLINEEGIDSNVDISKITESLKKTYETLQAKSTQRLNYHEGATPALRNSHKTLSANSKRFGMSIQTDLDMPRQDNITGFVSPVANHSHFSYLSPISYCEGESAQKSFQTFSQPSTLTKANPNVTILPQEIQQKPSEIQSNSNYEATRRKHPMGKEPFAVDRSLDALKDFKTFTPRGHNSNGIALEQVQQTQLYFDSSAIPKDSLNTPQSVHRIQRDYPHKEVLVKKITFMISQELDRLFDSYKKKGKALTNPEFSRILPKTENSVLNESRGSFKKTEINNPFQFIQCTDTRSVYVRSPREDFRFSNYSSDRGSVNPDDRHNSARKSTMNSPGIEILETESFEEKRGENSKKRLSFRPSKNPNVTIPEKKAGDDLESMNAQEKPTSPRDENLRAGHFSSPQMQKYLKKFELLIPKGEELPRIDESKNEVLDTDLKERLSISSANELKSQMISEELRSHLVTEKRMLFTGEQHSKFRSSQKDLKHESPKPHTPEEFFTPQHEESVNYESIFPKKQGTSTSKPTDQMIAAGLREGAQDVVPFPEFEANEEGKAARRIGERRGSLARAPGFDRRRLSKNSLLLQNDELDCDVSLQAKTCEIWGPTGSNRSNIQTDRSIRSEPDFEASAWRINQPDQGLVLEKPALQLEMKKEASLEENTIFPFTPSNEQSQNQFVVTHRKGNINQSNSIESVSQFGNRR